MEYERESVCPVCLKRIPARHEQQGDDVYLVKECPEHGEFRAVIWRSQPSLDLWRRDKIPSYPAQPATGRGDGCPFDCGLCPDHRQHTCTAVIEITERCNLHCPVCFAVAGEKEARPDRSVEEVREILAGVMRVSGKCNIQFSGGEPSVHPELCEMIRVAKEMGFPFVQLNTNGRRAALEPDFAVRLAEAGLDSAFFQFDGTRDDIYESLRGQRLLSEKQTALKRFIDAGIGVVLVPTVVPGVNADNVGDILRLAAENVPGVRGVHFQPVSYFGRYPAQPEDASRITLPEVMTALEIQTNGMVHAEDFLPPGCEHFQCSFHANYLVMEDGLLKRLSANRSGCGCKSEPQVASKGADKAKGFVSRQWAAAPEPVALQDKPVDDLDRFLARASTHILAVSGMAFQDAWTMDLDRVKGCCIHIAGPGGKLVPFCAYNLSSMQGETLYRPTPGVKKGIAAHGQPAS